jgi:hypothetical protein
MESTFLFEGFKSIYGDYVLLRIFRKTKLKLAAHSLIFYAISIL